MIASTKPSWIVMTAIAPSVSAHWRPFATAATLTTKPSCHVRDFQRSAVDHRAADHDSRHDVFASSHHGGVGSDAGDDQVKTVLIVVVPKLTSSHDLIEEDRCSHGSGDSRPLDSVAVFREFTVPEVVTAVNLSSVMSC